MAKKFYTLAESAEKLGIDPEEVKALASEGKIQQFRDRDRLMFKRDQIDTLVQGGQEESAGSAIPLADAGDSGEISLADPTVPDSKQEDPRQATGVSVFDAGEVNTADPDAQTEVTEHSVADDDDLALESVGSGSGLLDLTRESDDTSLGAELLDEIYPASEEDSDTRSGAAGTGSFQDAASLSAARTEGASPAAGVAPAVGMIADLDSDEYDPAGSGMSTGLLIGTSLGLVIALIVAISAVTNVHLSLTKLMSNTSPPGLYAGGLLVLSLVLALVGFLIGRRSG